jgi:hypothetical protein
MKKLTILIPVVFLMLCNKKLKVENFLPVIKVFVKNLEWK